MTKRNFLFILLVIANLIWSGSFVATSIAVREVNPVLLTMIRLICGALVLSPWLVMSIRRTPHVWSVSAFLKLALLGVIGFTLPLSLETAGIYVSTPALGAVSIALEPLFTVAIASIVLKESLSWRQRAAMGAAAIGAWIVGGCPRPGVKGYLLGDVLLLCAVLCYASYNAVSGRLTKNIPATGAISVTLFAGALGCLPLWLCIGHPLPTALSPAAISSIVFLTILATAGAYLIWLLVLQDSQVSSAAISLYLQPVFGVIFSVMIVHSHPTWFFYTGALVIVGAVYVSRKTLASVDTAVSFPASVED